MKQTEPRLEATTPTSGSVAAPSLRSGSLGKQSLDLLKLGLKHTLDLVPLAIDLRSHLSLQGGELGIRLFGRVINGRFELLLVGRERLDLLFQRCKPGFVGT